jgi:hypothetical protein
MFWRAFIEKNPGRSIEQTEDIQYNAIRQEAHVFRNVAAGFGTAKDIDAMDEMQTCRCKK